MNRYIVSESGEVVLKSILDSLVGENASKKLRARYSTLGDLRTDLREGKATPKITKKQRLKLVAALVDAPILAASEEATPPGEKVNQAGIAVRLLRPLLRDLEHEVFAVVFLDQKHKVIDTEIIARGSISSASVPPREVLKAAMRHNAAAVIFAHNHPSDDVMPSADDRRITENLKNILNVVDVRVIDHLIFPSRGDAYFSFAQEGIL